MRRRGAVALLATSACTAFVLHRAAPRAACIRAAESEEESKRSKAKKLWDKLRGKDETDQRPPTLDAVQKSRHRRDVRNRIWLLSAQARRGREQGHVRRAEGAAPEAARGEG